MNVKPSNALANLGYNPRVSQSLARCAENEQVTGKLADSRKRVSYVECANVMQPHWIFQEIVKHINKCM